MRFPGKRKSKHYFPVEERSRFSHDKHPLRGQEVYISGIAQPLVDIEASVTDEFMQKYNLVKGESQLLEEKVMDAIYTELKSLDAITGHHAGGAVGNTLHNFSVLSDSKSVLFGSISQNISIGDYSFRYIRDTNSLVDLTYLQSFDGPIARAICFVTPDGERSFAFNPGISDTLHPDYISEDVIKDSAGLLLTAFIFRRPETMIYQSAMKATELAKKYDVPIILGLGTSHLVIEKKEFLQEYIEKYVSVLAMNTTEGEALTGETDPLLIGQKAADLCDLVLLTDGEKGLYLCGHVDKDKARHTKDSLHSKSITNYNQFEYSRAMRKADCECPIKVYTHINPFMGGPYQILNTNGAGDAALSALLHDLAANCFHRGHVPTSPKHDGRYLTYSSFSQISKYCNRASYEVLLNRSPRLRKGLPEREDCLEDSYWD
jgi:inosine kinase